MTSPLIVVGASLAGLRAVQTARKIGFDGEIVLIGAEAHLPYNRPPLSKGILEDTASVVDLPAFVSEQELRADLRVDLRLSTRATRLEADRNRLHVLGASGADVLEYGTLIIATGAEARGLPSDELAGVHTLRTFDDATAIRDALERGARTVVVGAGFIGSEVASSVRRRGLPVTVLEALSVPLARAVGDDLGRKLADLHRENGTDLRCDVKVTGLRGVDGRVTGVELGDGTLVPADLVLIGTGVTPCAGWLAGSGVVLHERDGGIVCDETLSTGLPGVYAAGDVAHFPHRLYGGDLMRLEHWTNASEQGALAVKNALEPAEASSMGSVPYFWSDWYGKRIQFVGAPKAHEIRLVSEELGDSKLLALYRWNDRLSGCLAIDRAGQVMKYQLMIARSKTWSEALTFAGVS